MSSTFWFQEFSNLLGNTFVINSPIHLQKLILNESGYKGAFIPITSHNN